MSLRRNDGQQTPESRPKRRLGRRVVVLGATLAITAGTLAATATGASALPNTDQCQAYDSALAWDLDQANYWDGVAYWMANQQSWSSMMIAQRNSDMWLGRYYAVVSLQTAAGC